MTGQGPIHAIYFLGNVSQPDLGEATVADVAAGAVAAAVAVAVAVAVVAL